MFRRRLRPLRPNHNLLQPIQRAIHLLSLGQPEEAAVIFAQLAEQLEARSQPRRAANLHAQAAHAYFEALDAPSTLAQARAALNLFRQFQMEPRFKQFYANITHKLQSQGMASAAVTLQAEFGVQAGADLPQPEAPAAKHSGRLPVACTQCGGPIRSDEADWVDEHTIECVYCGALIQSA
jgi:hypothetical protein